MKALDFDLKEAARLIRLDGTDNDRTEFAAWLDDGMTELLPYGGDRRRTLLAIARLDMATPAEELAAALDVESDHNLRGRLNAVLWLGMRGAEVVRTDAAGGDGAAERDATEREDATSHDAIERGRWKETLRAGVQQRKELDQ